MTQLDTLYYQGTGKSLWPLARPNSLVEVQMPACLASLKKGELIAYCSLKETVCHRILNSKTEDGILWFFCKGDRNLEPDGWIPSYRIIGSVTHLNGRAINTYPLSLFSFLMHQFSQTQWLLYRFFVRGIVSRFIPNYSYHFLSTQNL